MTSDGFARDRPMQIYHITDRSAGTKILMSHELKTNDEGKVFFCKTFGDAERLIKWWQEISFKPEAEHEILELTVEEIPHHPDPHTSRFHGFYANQDMIVRWGQENV